MRSLAEIKKYDSGYKEILIALSIAFAFELLILIGVGILRGFIFSSPSQTFPQATLIQAQLIQLPSERAAHHVSKDTISKSLTHAKVKPVIKTTQNKQGSGSPLGPTHGPVALYTPHPVIPNYLRNRVMNTAVIIQIFIDKYGTVSAQLLSSCGNAILDAIALKTVKEWKFLPATDNSIPINASVKLRINFQIY
jgi:protein TonB